MGVGSFAQHNSKYLRRAFSEQGHWALSPRYAVAVARLGLEMGAALRVFLRLIFSI
jgi:hypothetical protein